MMRFKTRIREYFLVSFDSKNQTIFSNFINYIFLFSLTLIMTIGRIYPLNYFANVTFIIMCVLMLIYVKLYGNFIVDKFIGIILLLNLVFIFSGVLNKFKLESFTLVYLTIGMIPTYLYFKQSKKNQIVGLNLLPFAYIIFNIFFLVLYRKEILSFDFSVRLGDKIGNQNDVATYLLTGHGILLFLILNNKYYVIPFILLNLIEMISTGSRAGLLNLIFISLLAFYLRYGKKRKGLFALITFLVIVSFYLLLFLPQLEQLKVRFDNLFLELFANQNTDESAANRLNVVFEISEYFLRNLFFGGGRNTTNNFTLGGQVAHNAYLELGASYGLFYLILYVLLFLFPLFKTKSKNYDYTLIIVSSFIIFFITLSGYYYKPPYYIIPLFAAFNNEDNGIIFFPNKRFPLRSF